MSNYEHRKQHHIELCLREDVVFPENCKHIFNEIFLVHRAIPGIRLDNVDLSAKFLGYELQAPIIIEAMTGGLPASRPINENLAKIAHKFKISIGVGSQRPILQSSFKQEVIDTYRVVREIAHDVPVIGNIGITQLREVSIDVIKMLIDTINADALAIHLNPAQEAVQPEGDIDFSEDLYYKVRDVVRELNIPVIIKEVGHGLSIEVLSKLVELGVHYVDTAGACGTNWAIVEALRNPKESVNYYVGLELADWGIPTPLSVIEARSISRELVVIASGGVWNGIKALKVLALGANLVGFARPLLKALLEQGLEGAETYIKRYLTTLRTVMFLVGAKDLKSTCKIPIVLGSTIINYLTQRGINPVEYVKRLRCGGYF
jgi:isopentenyl-diphosphate delta-isomerase